MRTALEQRVLDFIRESRMAAAGDRVGVAVSGGADSVALLRLLESLRDELGVALVVIHFDHMLRGEESDRDASFVEELARASGLEFVSAREDVRAAAAANGWNMEEAARRLRYAFFDRVLSRRKSDSHCRCPHRRRSGRNRSGAYHQGNRTHRPGQHLSDC